MKVINIDKARAIQEMRMLIRQQPTMIGKLINFEGYMKGNKRAGIQQHSDVVVDVRFGRKGTIYHTARGIKVPESLITGFSDPTPDQIPRDDAFALHEHMMLQMRELVGHMVTWASNKAGTTMEGMGVRCGKRRLTVMATNGGGKWMVPLNLIRTKDGQPWSYRKPG